MATDWEDKFRAWARAPSDTEQQKCDNAVNAIKNAVNSSNALKEKDTRVFAQGSYRNRTNVRRESDVDVGVVCYNTFFYVLPGNAAKETFNITDATYSYHKFKNDVESALVSHFGSGAVSRGNKSFDIKETSYHIEADVAPFFEHRRYNADGRYISGVELEPDNYDPPRVINWPEQHYKNGVTKNDSTNRRYKALVRILKTLRNEMDNAGIQSAKPIIGFLSECLIWNVPNNMMSAQNYTTDVKRALIYLYDNTKTQDVCNEWREVSELKYLFRSNQKWSRGQANKFLYDAWNYLKPE